jgi:hypothetical protein
MFLGSRARSACMDGNVTAICEQIVYKIWDSLGLTTLQASTACCRDIFAFLLYTFQKAIFRFLLYLQSRKSQQALNLLVTEERYWTLFYMPLYKFFHSLLSVLVDCKWNGITKINSYRALSLPGIRTFWASLFQFHVSWSLQPLQFILLSSEKQFWESPIECNINPWRS